MKLLEVTSLSKTYITGSEELEVLRDVKFNLKEGERVAITGESGCGKTTLLNLIGGLDTPTKGNIYI